VCLWLLRLPALACFAPSRSTGIMFNNKETVSAHKRHTFNIRAKSTCTHSLTLTLNTTNTTEWQHGYTKGRAAARRERHATAKGGPNPKREEEASGIRLHDLSKNEGTSASAFPSPFPSNLAGFRSLYIMDQRQNTITTTPTTTTCLLLLPSPLQLTTHTITTTTTTEAV